MTYIVERNSRFYVVAYDGLDPLTGQERRAWIPIGHDRSEAEIVAARLDSEHDVGPPLRRGSVSVGEFLTRTWMPNKRRHVRATTAYRYAWFIDRYVNPAIGDIPLRRLRSDHLDGLYEQLATSGGRTGTGLAPKTITEVHMIVRAALDDAGTRELVSRNVAHHVRSHRRPPAQAAARSWTALELNQFLTAARSQRVKRSDVSRIRFHDLRHTHASLLVADGIAIKVVSERLGHAHPAFTMHTYQHLLPGMSATAAEQFATLIATAGR